MTKRKLTFAVTAFNAITGRRIVVSRHGTEATAWRAAQKYALKEIRVELLCHPAISLNTKLVLEAEAKATAAARIFETTNSYDAAALSAAEADFRKACDEVRALRDGNDK